MKPTHVALVLAIVAVSLAIPTAAVTLGEDEVGGVTMSPHEGPNGAYATVQDDEIRIDADALNDRSRTTVDDVFTVTATGETEQTVWLRSDVEGVTFYRGDDSSRQVSGVALSPGQMVDIGIVVDTGAAVEDGVFAVEVRTADGPSLNVTDVTVNRTSIQAGEDAAVTATVANDGDIGGTRTLALGVDGIGVAQQTVTVPAGERTTVTFVRSFDQPGEFDVDVDGRAGETVSVGTPDSGEDDGDEDENDGDDEDGDGEDDESEGDESDEDTDEDESDKDDSGDDDSDDEDDEDDGDEDGSAAFDVRDAALSETAVGPGGAVDVTATVENVGSADGTFTAELHVGGTVVETRDVVVPAGEERTVTFTRQFARPGTYRVGISGDEAGDVVVEGPNRPTLLPSERTLQNPATGTVAVTLAFGAFVFGRTRVRDLLTALR
jgi:hypothetical protein